MAYARKAYGRRRVARTVRGSGRTQYAQRGRAAKPAVRGGGRRAPARRTVTKRAAPARQTVRVEIVYRDPQTLARPQGTETVKKGSKPRL